MLLRGRAAWPRGLRSRVVLAFVVVTMTAAVLASGAGYLAARDSLVDATQDHLVGAVRDQINRRAPEMTYPPDDRALERLRAALGDDSMVTYRGRTSASGRARAFVSDELRAAVDSGDTFAVQRVVDDSGPKLVIGTPILLTGADGRQRDSGVDVYVVEDLQSTEAQLDNWARMIALGIVIALPAAIVLALVVSRSVLRPVRRLADSANQLAAGNLSTRLAPTGRDELAGLATTFNRTAAALEETVGELRHQEAEARRFVGDVSHELRTPIMALTSIMEILEADARGRSAEDHEMAELAVDRTRKLARLTADLLEISRLDAGAVTLRLERIDVAHAVVDTFRTRGWTDEVEFAPAGAVLARVDVRRLDIAVANLVGNARHHGRPPIVVEVIAEADDVVIVVTDHGPGLPGDAEPEQLFTRFYKADSARSSSDGSGLGLSIARANVALHGGRVYAGNAEGGGARFLLRLPRRLDDEEDDARA